jgi:hypothetical protein
MTFFNLVFWSAFCVLAALSARPVHAEAVVKKVCHDVKGKQVCKNIKTHKKVEGTAIPEAPAKKKK